MSGSTIRRKSKVAIAVMTAIGAAAVSQAGVAGGGWGATELVTINVQNVQAEGLIALSESQDINKAGADVDAGDTGGTGEAFAGFGSLAVVSGTELSDLSNNPEGVILFGGGATATAGGDFGDPSLTTSATSAGGSFAGVTSSAAESDDAAAEAATATYALGIVSSDLDDEGGQWNSIEIGDDSDPSGTPNTAVANVNTDDLEFNGPGALSFAAQAAYTDGEGDTGTEGGTIQTYGLAGSGGITTVSFGGDLIAVIGTMGGGSSAGAGLALSGEINTLAGAATGGFITTLSDGVEGDADASASGASAGLGIVTADGCFNCGDGDFSYNVVTGAN